MEISRKSGILLHPTSLPSKYGIGDMGKAAYDFIDFLEKNDYTYFDWNVASGDAALKELSQEEIVKNVTENLNTMQQAVVLLHDAANRITTVEALPVIIEKVLELDRTVFLPITEDTVPVQHLESKEE